MKALKYLRKFLFPILILLVAVAYEYIRRTFFPPETAIPSIFDQFGTVLLITSVSWGLIAVLRISKKLIISRYDIHQEDNLKSRKVVTQLNIIERIFVFVIIFAAVATTLMLFEDVRQIGINLFASAGITGIILGLAAQKVIGAVLAGLQIALAQPIRLDDVVIVEGEWGRIEEVNLTFVVIKIWDKRRLVVPSTYFLEKPFQNWTRVSSELVGAVYIYADYQLPFDPVRKALTEILSQTPFWDGKVNVLQITDATPSVVEMRALVSAKDASTAWDLRVHVREKLIVFIRENYPQHLPQTRINIKKEGDLPPS